MEVWKWGLLPPWKIGDFGMVRHGLFQSLASPELSWEPCSSSCCQVYGDVFKMYSNLALETAG